MRRWRARILWTAGAFTVLAIGLVVFMVWKKHNDEPARDHQPGFKEYAAQAGITFHMSFLPGEQGEKFKINLYDHGCGVAIGDYNGDGYDDIYFVNQLGRNALYRNNGNGTFTDVTKQTLGRTS